MKEILEGINEFVNGCLGPLGSSNGSFYGWPDWIRDFLIQALAFLVLFFVVRFFLWKPLSNYLAKKAEATDKTLMEAQEVLNSNLEKERELDKRFAEASEEIDKLLEKARLEGEKKRESIINEAKEEARRRVEAADTQIALDIKRQKEDIREAIIEIAFLAASKIAGEEVDKKKYLALVEQIIDSGLKDE